MITFPAGLISIIGFVESVSVAQTLAAKKRQRISPDQELIGLGAANIGAAFTGGYPVTGGFARSVVNYDAGAEKTLMMYMMYDVQPVNPEDWESPPFDAEVIDHELGKVLMARGATNQKGPQRAFLNALEPIIATAESQASPDARIRELMGQEELRRLGWIRVVERQPHVRGHEELRAVGAAPDAADALGVEVGSPLLALRRRSYNQVDGGEHLMDYLEVFYHPERFQYRMDLTLDGS